MAPITGWARRWPASGVPPSYVRAVAKHEGRKYLTRSAAYWQFTQLYYLQRDLTRVSPHLFVAMADLLVRRGEQPNGVEIRLAALLYYAASEVVDRPERRQALQQLAWRVRGPSYPADELKEHVLATIEAERKRAAVWSARARARAMVERLRKER